MEPLLELLIELGARAKLAERVVAEQAKQIAELKAASAKPAPLKAVPPLEEKEDA